MRRTVVVLAVLVTQLACHSAERRVLILDLTLSDPALIESTAAPWAAVGYAVEYRPRYPHLTRADLGQYGVVLCLGGLVPTGWSDALSGGDLALLMEWVPRGGVLVFGYAGDGQGALDSWLMNRWLAAMGAGIAIGSDVLRDTAGTMSRVFPGHPTARAAAGVLSNSGLAYFPAGRNHALSVRSPAQAMARAPATAYVQRPGAAPLSRANAPVVAASRVGQGLVIVTSRHLLGAVGTELRAGVRSPLARDSLAVTRRFLEVLAHWTRHPAEWATIPPATGLGPLELTTPPRPVAMRAPRLTPPSGTATWRVPRSEGPDSAGTDLPDWLAHSGVRVGWSDAPLTDPATMDSLIGFLDAAGLNVLASPPGQALLADTAVATRRTARPADPAWLEALGRLGATSIRWFPMLRLGGPDQPCILDDSLWDGTIGPVVRVLAERARMRGGPLAGVTFVIEPEVADSGAPALCPANLRSALRRMGRDTAWIERLVTLSPDARYDALLDAGLLDPYFVALEAEVAARAAGVARLAHERAPALLFALWTTDPPADWRSFGLARGLGVDEGPVLLWDAEPLPSALLDAYRRRNVRSVHVLRVRPEQIAPRSWGRLAAVVFDASAGFWLGPIETLMAEPQTAAGPLPADSLERLVRHFVRQP